MLMQVYVYVAQHSSACHKGTHVLASTHTPTHAQTYKIQAYDHAPSLECCSTHSHTYRHGSVAFIKIQKIALKM